MDVISLDPDFKGTPPNIILINCDDLGYGDLGSYGGNVIKTPNIDEMASKGVRFTDFHACDSVCTPSRAGLLTGRYPKRMKLDFPLQSSSASIVNKLLFKLSFLAGSIGFLDSGSSEGASGLNDFEITAGEALQLRGYKTALVGKWHLGDFSKETIYNPLNHGFMSFFGVPHANDMNPLPLFRDRQMLEENISDQSQLTSRYTDESIKFIESSMDKPFFLYLAHTFPHRPIAASENFKNKSLGGIYGDAVEEIDWNFGRLMNTLTKNGLDRSTLILFTSDNGPWYDGSSGNFRGHKGQSFEGGFRVPLIARWDGKIPKGSVCNSLTMNTDLFPTLLSLAGIKIPNDRIIDGKSITELLINPNAQQAERDLYFYHQGELECMREGDWKYIKSINHYIWPMPVNRKLGGLSNHTTGPLPMLFNLRTDPGESYNLADRYPDKVKELDSKMVTWEDRLNTNLFGLVGKS
jgi:arylsulfatase A-like enzyme